MAKIYGGKNKYLIKKEFKLFSFGELVIPLMSFFFCGYIFSNILKFKGNILGVLIIIFITLFFSLKVLREEINTKANNYHDGRIGEEGVLRILKTLPDDYAIFYNVKLPCREDNIDLVLIGLCGVLVLEVKNSKGFITYSDKKLFQNWFKFPGRNPIKQAKGNAKGLNIYLKEQINKDIYVKPVVVFSHKYTNMRFGLKPVDDTNIIHKEYLLKLVDSLPVMISWEEALSIEQVLRSLCN